MVNFNNKTKVFFDNIAEGIRKDKKKNIDKSSQLELQKLLKFLNLKKGSRLIELGCGTGRFVLFLLKNGFRVTGIDISQISLDVLKDKANKFRLNKNLKLVLDDFKKPILKNSFDGALCISTFHLLSDKESKRIKILSNLTDSLKKGGRLFVIEPNPLNILFYSFYLFHPKTDWNIEKHFIKSNERNLRRIFNNLGLEKIEVDYFGFLPSRLINKYQFIAKLNNFLNKIPVVNKFSAFIFIKGIKE